MNRVISGGIINDKEWAKFLYAQAERRQKERESRNPKYTKIKNIRIGKKVKV